LRLRKRPFAFIDFAAAHPGYRREDVGYAAWLWLDIGNAVFTPHIHDRRIVDFFLAYGAINTTDALPAVAVRGTLAATDHPKAATADPKMFFQPLPSGTRVEWIR
jgi:hypothetical protein